MLRQLLYKVICIPSLLLINLNPHNHIWLVAIILQCNLRVMFPNNLSLPAKYGSKLPIKSHTILTYGKSKECNNFIDKFKS